VHVPELSRQGDYGVYCYQGALYRLWDETVPYKGCYELSSYDGLENYSELTVSVHICG